ncbi:acyl-CoA thioesterase [Phenylobacterium sp.]|uniref:acyl-CoA thioesterase n=1 Tax=Phenylobacterium sp. TaxID=1871053 RepID=UPI002FCAAE96
MTASATSDDERRSTGPAVAKSYIATHPIRFSHVDPAGIVFYPRYFELIDAVVEDWSRAVLGVDRRTMHSDMLLGLPVSEMRVKFQQPSRLGDLLTFNLSVMEVGRASVHVSIAVSCGGQRRLTAEMTLVLMSLATMRGCAWPDPWRATLLAVSASSGTEE